MKENGVLITVQDYEGEFRPKATVEPVPIFYMRKVSTDHGAAPNPDQLRTLRQ